MHFFQKIFIARSTQFKCSSTRSAYKSILKMDNKNSSSNPYNNFQQYKSAPYKATRTSIFCSTRRITLMPWPYVSLNHSLHNIPLRCYANGFMTSQCWPPALIYGNFLQSVSQNNCPNVWIVNILKAFQEENQN